jgi:hypothetical protein
MENDFARELEMLGEQISDESLEILAAGRADKACQFTLYGCTGLYFCPGP